MNGEREIESGGSTIIKTPSARRGIHDHSENMGTHGLNKSPSDSHRRQNNPQNSRDEIDNVQSKLYRTPSPIPQRINNKRRASYDLPSEACTDDSDNSIICSQSLPKDFSPNSSEDSPELSNRSNQINYIPEGAVNNISINSSWSTPGTVPKTPERNKYYDHQETSSQGWTSSLCILMLVVLAAFGVKIYLSSNVIVPDFLTTKNYNNNEFKDDLNGIGERFKINEDSILQIQAGVSTIFERQDTGSFVFVYNSDENKFDHGQFNNFINNVASTVSKYLRQAPVQHIVVESSKLNMRTHAELMNKYHDNVKKNGVILIKDVDEVPSELAMAFHYYCDEYNPLVKKSAVFFTLDISKCFGNRAEQIARHAQIEKCLKQKWSGVPQDNIGPLLNRVVNTVVDITGN